MTILDTLITDRAREDVLRAREIFRLCNNNYFPPKGYAAGLRGCYGPSDMNRVVGAMAYIDQRMREAKRESVYVPTVIAHAEIDWRTEEWTTWSDTVWRESDYPTLELWTAHLANIDRLWEAARRFDAAALPRYDPDGNGYIFTGTVIDAGQMFRVTGSVGLMELRVTAVCPLDVTAEGTAWTVSQTDTGWVAALDYVNGPYPDIDDALAALKITSAADAVIDGAFSLSATLRRDYVVSVPGACAVRWSPFIIWGEAREKYGVWGGAKPRTWDEAARGGTA